MAATPALSGDGSAEGLWPDEAVRQERLRRYQAMNAGWDRPLVLHLTRRGFFSEVNFALDAVLFALTERRRLALMPGGFNKLRWRDYFASELPPPDGLALEAIPPDDHLHKPKDAGFRRVREWVWERSRSAAGFRLPELGIEGGVFEAKRALFRIFCRPSEAVQQAVSEAMAQLGLEPGRFAAVHMRRGDKLTVWTRDGKTWSEGEDTPAACVADMVGRLSPHTRDVFVLTDDYAAVEDLRRASPGRRVVTLCPPDAAGHEQDSFNAASREEKAAIIERLVVECVMAAQSDAFAGGFKSNVAKFVTSIHRDPARCCSTDSQLDPWSRPQVKQRV